MLLQIFLKSLKMQDTVNAAVFMIATGPQLTDLISSHSAASPLHPPLAILLFFSKGSLATGGTCWDSKPILLQRSLFPECHIARVHLQTQAKCEQDQHKQTRNQHRGLHGRMLGRQAVSPWKETSSDEPHDSGPSQFPFLNPKSGKEKQCKLRGRKFTFFEAFYVTRPSPGALKNHALFQVWNSEGWCCKAQFLHEDTESQPSFKTCMKSHKWVFPGFSTDPKDPPIKTDISKERCPTCQATIKVSQVPKSLKQTLYIIGQGTALGCRCDLLG